MIVYYNCEHCDGEGVKKFWFLTLGRCKPCKGTGNQRKKNPTPPKYLSEYDYSFMRGVPWR